MTATNGHRPAPTQAADQPCPHCARIGAIAAATQDALQQLNEGLTEMRALASQVGAIATSPFKVRRHGVDDPRLSDKEMVILHGIAAGKTNAQIGRTLFIAEETVKTHVRNICSRLGANGRANAVHLAHMDGHFNNYRSKAESTDA